MNVIVSSGRNMAWLEVAACPDCLEPLETQSESESAVCTLCERPFQAVGDSLNLLPRGIAARERKVAPTGRSWRSAFVSTFYTRHNRSANVRRAIDQVVRTLAPNEWGLNLGSADTGFTSHVINLDIVASPHVDVVATADRLPFRSDSLGCVVSQEVFEHLRDPYQAAREVLRVLRPGGQFYFQVPFIIGFHSGPHDYWRFTQCGVRQLLGSAGFEIVEVGPAVGAGTSIYRISVEFAALLAGSIHHKLYFPAKAVSAVALAPFRWFDLILSERRDINRISAGFYAIARKPTLEATSQHRRYRKHTSAR